MPQHGRGAQAILIEPAYGYAGADGSPVRPRASAALAEWLDAVNVFKGRRRVVPFVTATVHIGSAVATLVYVTRYLTWANAPAGVFTFCLAVCFGVVYHSVWWHRYCTHKAFTLKSTAWARVFGWTNPLFYRDETFVIPHRVHHQIADLPGDPYTPLSGWLVCYLSAETQQRLNTDIPRAQYDALVRGLRHTGARLNSYEAFRRTGSVEHVGSFFLHALFAQALWVVPLAMIGGTVWVLSFYAAVFWTMFFVRDFTYRGHTDRPDHTQEPGWELSEGRALNHRMYGFITGEWHNNHHAYPSSARMDFIPGQPDVGFLFVRGLHRLGIVAAYIDQRAQFLATHGRVSREAVRSER